MPGKTRRQDRGGGPNPDLLYGWGDLPGFPKGDVVPTALVSLVAPPCTKETITYTAAELYTFTAAVYGIPTGALIGPEGPY